MSTSGGEGSPDQDGRPAASSLAWITVKHDDAPDVSVLYEVTADGVPVRDRWLEVASSVIVGLDEME
jgi:hypothetical protein